MTIETHHSRHSQLLKQRREQKPQKQSQEQCLMHKQQQQHRQETSIIQYNHRLQYLQLPQPFLIVVVALILATICVNGQIDGYVAGADYPIYDNVPRGLSFNCQGRTPGYYADIETRCQVWHWCLHSGHQYSFLCPNGTVFNQAVRVCDWWSNVNCPASEQLYLNNEDLYQTVMENKRDENV